MPVVQENDSILQKRNTVVLKHHYRTLAEQVEANNGLGVYCVNRGLGGIGDVLMTLPAIKALKHRYPKIELVYACWRPRGPGNDNYYELLKNIPYIDSIIDTRDVHQYKWDGYVDITSPCIRYENSGLPTMNRIDLFAAVVGVKPKDYIPDYFVEDHEREKALTLMQKNPNRKYVFLHVSSFDSKRNLPVSSLIRLIELTENMPIHWVVSDWNNKREWPTNVLDISTSTLREMAAVISECDFFVGPDSGPMHLAGALGIPSAVVFGSIPPMARINHYPTHEGLTRPNTKCLGCWYAECKNDFVCMKDFDVQQIVQRIQKRLLQ
jgi:ADP-heptose:LPS heptosyltransferase